MAARLHNQRTRHQERQQSARTVDRREHGGTDGDRGIRDRPSLRIRMRIEGRVACRSIAPGKENAAQERQQSARTVDRREHGGTDGDRGIRDRPSLRIRMRIEGA